MKLRKNDEVIILIGKDKGKTGKILEIIPKTQRIKVSGVNMIKKHIKPSQQNTEGGIQETEGTIHVSNVAYLTKGKNGVGSKLGYKRYENKPKKRIIRKTGKEI